MYDNDQYNSGSYRYSYPPARQGDPWDRPQTPLTPPRPPRKKKRGAARTVALVLCCALAGGGAGLGGAALYHTVFTPESNVLAVNGSGSGVRDDGTTIYRNETDPAPVQVNQADGLTPMSLAEINAAYADSCVCITVQTTVRQGYYQYPATSAGSGFIISEDGYIVTNYHVIDGATAIKITLYNGESYDARLIGGEELNDVAVLKINGISGLKPVVIGDSDDLVVGETVCTIGNALGTLSFSLTSGAVSATGRSVTMSDGTVMNMIQTECTINSGNSGGPLFDSYGRVAGITSAKYSNNGSTDAAIEGIGFAIPINDVIDIVTDYMQVGYVTGRPYMGILEPKDISEYAQTFGWPNGVYVTNIDQNSCAMTAGLKPGDIITKIDDTEITSVNQMVSVKNSYKAGDTVTIEVYRSGERLTLTLTFDEQDNTAGSQSSPQDPAVQPTDYSYGGYGYDYQYPYNWDDFYDGFPWSYFFRH